ncbi:MAG: hypothetical protein ACRDRL_15020 [Sciscionella sp.]
MRLDLRSGQGTTVAARVNWLFDVTVAAVVDGTGTGTSSWRPRTNIEVGKPPRKGERAASSTTVRQLQAGAPATKDQLVATAGFLGVGIEHVADIAVEADAVRGQMLDPCHRDL